MMAEEIRAVLAHGPRTMGEIIDALGVRSRKATAAAYKQAVYVSARQGILARDADGRYYVAREPQGRPDLAGDVSALLRERGPVTVKEAVEALGPCSYSAAARALRRAAVPVGHDGRSIVYALPGEARRRGMERVGADVEGYLREHGPSTVREAMEALGLSYEGARVALERDAVRLDGKRPYRYALREESHDERGHTQGAQGRPAHGGAAARRPRREGQEGDILGDQAQDVPARQEGMGGRHRRREIGADARQGGETMRGALCAVGTIREHVTVTMADGGLRISVTSDGVSASTTVNKAGAEAVRDALARAVEGWE